MEKGKRQKWFFIISLAVECVLFFFFVYGDIAITTRHGINFWECLFSGNIRNFYQYSLEAQIDAGAFQGQISAAYDFMIYIIFAIWDFPLWAVGKLFGVNALGTFLGNVWMKLIVVPFFVGTMAALWRILDILQAESGVKKRLVYLFCTSVFVVGYLVIMAQYDVIPMFFVLAGTYAYLRDRKGLFYLLFAIAIPIKIFALFFFIPLVLYMEKNLLKDAVWIVLALIPTALLRIWIPLTEDHLTYSYIGYMFGNKISVTFYPIALFVAAFAAVCLISYIRKPAVDLRQRARDAIYLEFLSIGAFMIFGQALPYWYYYLCPLMFLIMAFEPRYHFANTLLELAAAFCTVLGQTFIFTWCFSAPVAANMLFGKLLVKEEISSVGVYDILQRILSDELYAAIYSELSGIFMAAGTAALLIFAYMNCPWCRGASDASSALVLNAREETALYVVRLAAGYVICAIPLASYMIA